MFDDMDEGLDLNKFEPDWVEDFVNSNELEDFVENQSLDDFLGTTIDVVTEEIIDPVKTKVSKMDKMAFLDSLLEELEGTPMPTTVVPSGAVVADVPLRLKRGGSFLDEVISDTPIGEASSYVLPKYANAPTKLVEVNAPTRRVPSGDSAFLDEVARDILANKNTKVVKPITRNKEAGLLKNAASYLRDGAQGDFKFRDLMNKNVATLGGSAAGLALLNAIEGDSLLGNIVQTGTGVGLGALAGGLIRNTRYGSSPFGGLIVGGAALAGNTLMGAIGSMLGMDEKDEQELYRQSLSYANGAAQQQQQAYAAQQPYE